MIIYKVTNGINSKIYIGMTIRELFASGNYTQQEIADKFTISRRNVSHITTRRTWKYI